VGEGIFTLAVLEVGVFPGCRERRRRRARSQRPPSDNQRIREPAGVFDFGLRLTRRGSLGLKRAVKGSATGGEPTFAEIIVSEEVTPETIIR